ncbi:hypothetical protein EB061_12565 [bacterium]|nr:hypothetical protein [bacterium]
MNPLCKRCQKPGARNSFYLRKADATKVTQYRCFSCRLTWTDHTENLEKRQKLRSVNEALGRLLCSNVSMRRAAILLGINRKTVARRVPYLAEKAKQMQLQALPQKVPTSEVYLDELITFEHTRCKPVAVCVAVSKERKILALSVSPMPAIGKNLKKIALKKYGKRPNLRRKGITSCLRAIPAHVVEGTVFKSDEETSYAVLIRHHFPHHTHQSFPSKRAVIAGQGELKDHSYDPLFAINHTFAMVRANLARLGRRTWVTTKKLERLEDFLHIYAGFHNLELTAPAS